MAISREDAERRSRIRVAAAAYAYEVDSDPVMSDAEYDALAASIDVSIKTGNEKLDKFFEKHFAAHTGQWIHKHPDLNGVRRVVQIMRRKTG